MRTTLISFESATPPLRKKPHALAASLPVDIVRVYTQFHFAPLQIVRASSRKSVSCGDRGSLCRDCHQDAAVVSAG